MADHAGIRPGRALTGLFARRCAAALLALAAGTCAAAGMTTQRLAPVAPHAEPGQEHRLIEAIERIRGAQVDAALQELGALTGENPNFRLAQLMYADLLLSKTRPLREFGNLSSAPYQQILALRDEARARWQHHLAIPPPAGIPAALVKLSGQQKHAIVVDMSTSRLYLFSNEQGLPRLVQDFYATIGKNGTGKLTEGDQKTPVGVYFVTGFIDPAELPDFYGDGAFPIDYPNPWDQRLGRTGYGIWLHGTPSSTFSRPPRDSDGCVIVSNEDLKTIAGYITPGRTPVILTERIEWLDDAGWRERQAQMDGIVEQWRRDWESRDTDLYLSHYSRSYAGLGKDFSSWVEHKRRVNSNKRYIKVGISDDSMFLYPGERAMLVVTFLQDYSSDNFRRQFKKRQYWRMEPDGRWRIVYEGSLS
jgi:murein L,D-transpeptidase YafK